MKELSIFVDESGDFGKYAKHSPYYIVSIVAHDQSNPIVLFVTLPASNQAKILQIKRRYSIK